MQVMLQVTAREEIKQCDGLYASKVQSSSQVIPVSVSSSSKKCLSPTVGSTALGWWQVLQGQPAPALLGPPQPPHQPHRLQWVDKIPHSSTAQNSSPPSLQLLKLTLRKCPALHCRWDSHVYEDVKDSNTSKHSFVVMYHASLRLKKHFRGQVEVHTNTSSFQHKVMARTRMGSTAGMREPETLASGQCRVFRSVPSASRGRKPACNLALHGMPVYRLGLLVYNRKSSIWVSAGCSKA